MIHVTPHAVERFIERVAALPWDEAKAAILSHERAMETAVDFHCEVVRCGDGSRLILDGHKVVTVYGREQLPRQCRRGG
jgi:hypothetical protein